MEQEIWKPVKNYEGVYEVSDLARVRTVKRVITRCNGARQTINGRIKKANNSKNIYLTMALVKDNKTYTTYLHRMIGEAFIPKPKGMNVINHKNGIKTDNRIENLEWVNSSVNNKHAIDNFLRKPARSVIEKKEYNSILQTKAQGLTNKQIAKLLSLSVCTVRNVTSGSGYKRFSK